MALTIQTEIGGQEATSLSTYSYLYEPLRIVVSESDLSATKIYVDLQPIQTINGVPIATEVKYAEFDINPGQDLTFDLMKIVRQYHDANVYKFGVAGDMLGEGYKAITDQFRYKFNIYTDKTTTPSVVYKYPLIGGRILEQFVPSINQASPTNEFEYYGLNISELESRWGNTSIIKVVLSDPNLGGNVRPTITKISTVGVEPCGGWLIWKSRFGGWMFWGFDIKTKTFNKKYKGNLEVGMFESTGVGGNPFIPVDYTGIETSYNITMKSLGLSSLELLAVSGINSSPAVYFQEPGSNNIELMRLISASTPISSLANGGDFSVNLQSISKSSQNVI